MICDPELDCEIQLVDFRRGEQRTPGYEVLNPNRKMPALKHDGFVLWDFRQNRGPLQHPIPARLPK